MRSGRPTRTSDGGGLQATLAVELGQVALGDPPSRARAIVDSKGLELALRPEQSRRVTLQGGEFGHVTTAVFSTPVRVQAQAVVVVDDTRRGVGLAAGAVAQGQEGHEADEGGACEFH